MTTKVSTAMINQSGNVEFTGANVSLGNVANLHISGGNNGQVLTTDGAGNLTFANASGGTSNARVFGTNLVFGG